MLAALGAGPDEAPRPRRAPRSPRLPDDGLTGLAAVRERLRGIEVVVATDVDVTLLGFHGASASYAQDMGATPEGAQRLEAALGPADRGGAAHPAAGHRPAQRHRAAARPGARRRRCGRARLRAAAARRAPRGRRRGGAAGGAASPTGSPPPTCWSPGRASSTGRACAAASSPASPQAALAVAVPSVVLAGQVLVGRREAMALGISGTYAVAERPARVPRRPGRPGGHPGRPRGARGHDLVPAARRHDVRLSDVGNTSRRPWVGTVDRRRCAARSRS